MATGAAGAGAGAAGEGAERSPARADIGVGASEKMENPNPALLPPPNPFLSACTDEIAEAGNGLEVEVEV